MTAVEHAERVADSAVRSAVLSPRAGTALTVVSVMAFVLLAGGAIALSLAPDFPTPLAPMVALSALAVGTLLFPGRTLTFAVALILMLLSAQWGSGAELFLPIPFLLRAGIEHSARRVWTMFVASTLVVSVASVVLALRSYDGTPPLGLAPRVQMQLLTDSANIVIVVATLFLLVTLIALNVGHRRRLIAMLTERAEQLQRERDQQASLARADERERIAREMHDVIAHSLAVMIALSDGAQAAAVKRPDEAQRAVERIGETGRRTLAEVRRLLGAVRGESEQPAVPQPGTGDIETLVAEFRLAGLPVHATVVATPDPVLGFTIYRIVQEALTNVLRHGRGVTDVQVMVDITPAQARVVVEDTAEPPVRGAETGRGLLGMRERVAFYDGTVDAGPRADGGWRIDAVLSLHTEGRS